jgi:GNAT superfamily N-acetyltransferase
MSITFYNNSERHLDPSALNELYMAGGGKSERTLSKTQAVLDGSAFYVHAYYQERLVGFGRLLVDPYFAIILDLTTHPEYRKRGIATEILTRLIAYCKSQSLSIHLIDGSGCSGLYEKMGFKQADPNKEKIMYLKP